MKFILFIFMLGSSVQASSIEGVIKIIGETPKGTLFIFAKKHDGSIRMPLAVKRIESPSFPLKFSLDKSNQMVKSLPFKGPFTITARISPNGGAMDKSGIEVSTKAPIKLGDKNIELVLSK